MLFSVVIPTYNYGRFLRAAVESVLEQPGDDYETIVVDDGSTDDTPAVLEQFLAELPQRVRDRVRFVRQENAGPSAARNRGAAAAKGDYLVFLDADDRLLPGALERLRSYAADGGFDLIFGGYEAVTPAGRRTPRRAKPLRDSNLRNFKRFLRRRLGSVRLGAAAIRRSRFMELRFPEGVHHHEDVVLVAQLLATGRCVSFPEITLSALKHPDSLRHDLKGLESASTAAAEALFDPAVLPAEMMAMRREYQSDFFLTQFGALARAGRYAEARAVYRRAVREYPRHLLRWPKLRRYLRIVFK
ncbi:glycosyltransferase family 2 protein [Alienimonas californiensis]|uniref:GalNAc(5)-diNAcBac-PP-undecaprenol beta-1,3-glucosyltransferase n=1 Tax=Alienimonas californiensis TaxID=2527989 RepID=A0A517PF64_9PLAN|nr:glycosyltransferase family 2 protein [Alienimonas californiensis]QDT18005.1 GalNAc(5)-diNAcBac-PP-undecaprenol beta-1,3-glucosyltransferase [Alienimonas californiensis]